MSSITENVDDLVTNLAKNAEVLRAAASMEISDESAGTDAPVREMLLRASELVRGATVLGQNHNHSTLSVLSRAILENLILLLWVQVDEGNAHKLEEEAKSEIARVAKINFEKGKARILNRETGEDATAEFLGTARFKGLKRPPSIEARAKEAGVEDLYTVFYRFMSLEMHGFSLSQKEQSAERASIVQLQGIGALALASGHAGVRWLINRQRTDNESLRQLLGIGRPSPNKSNNFAPSAPDAASRAGF
jgi:hypothetical protein